jgi:hypothetical protein
MSRPPVRSPAVAKPVSAPIGVSTPGLLSASGVHAPGESRVVAIANPDGTVGVGLPALGLTINAASGIPPREGDPVASPLALFTHARALAARLREPLPRAVATLVTLGLAGHKAKGLPARYGQAFQYGQATVTLFPAGAVPGSAMVLVTDDRTGERTLVAGPVNTHGMHVAQPPKPVPCDTLVLCAPEFLGASGVTATAIDNALPPRRTLQSELLALCARSLTHMTTPEIYADVFGTALEAAYLMQHAGIGWFAHPQLARMIARIENLPEGYLLRLPKPHLVLDRRARIGVNILPVEALRVGPLRVADRRRARVLLSAKAWAAGRAPFGVDEVIPLSMSDDGPSLMAFAAACAPKQVWIYPETTAAMSAAVALARSLRAKGLAAAALTGAVQDGLPGLATVPVHPRAQAVHAHAGSSKVITLPKRSA